MKQYEIRTKDLKSIISQLPPQSVGEAGAKIWYMGNHRPNGHILVLHTFETQAEADKARLRPGRGSRFESMKIIFEPRDLWIGLYWTKARTTTLRSDTERYRFFVCLIPCFPIVFDLNFPIPAHKRHWFW